MDGSDLHFYLTWLKDQLRIPVRNFKYALLVLKYVLI
jgi:hypothetical protein